MESDPGAAQPTPPPSGGAPEGPAGQSVRHQSSIQKAQLVREQQAGAAPASPAPATIPQPVASVPTPAPGVDAGQEVPAAAMELEEAIRLNPEFDWTASVPKFDEVGEAVFFAYPVPVAEKAIDLIVTRAVANDICLILRQFESQRLFWGLSDIVIDRAESLMGEGITSSEAIAKGWYEAAVISRGLTDLVLNVTIYLGSLPPEEEEVVLPVSPLHSYGIWYACQTLLHYLVPKAREIPGWSFEDLDATVKACENVLTLQEGLTEVFADDASPVNNLYTRGLFAQLAQEVQRQREAGELGGAGAPPVAS